MPVGMVKNIFLHLLHLSNHFSVMVMPLIVHQSFQCVRRLLIALFHLRLFTTNMKNKKMKRKKQKNKQNVSMILFYRIKYCYRSIQITYEKSHMMCCFVLCLFISFINIRIHFIITYQVLIHILFSVVNDGIVKYPCQLIFAQAPAQ